jgi:hypothetical protein
MTRVYRENLYLIEGSPVMAETDRAPNLRENAVDKDEPKRNITAKPLVITEQTKISKEAGVTILKPGKITAIGGMRLGSGVCNILAGLVFCWLIFPIIIIPLGIVEIVSASNLLKTKPDRPSSLLAIPILEIIAILTLAGWVSVVVGIISLVFLSDQRVKSYLNQL